MIISFRSQNHANGELVDLLHENNIIAGDNCGYLEEFVSSWLLTAESSQPESSLLTTNSYLLWAEVYPVRCNTAGVQGDNGEVILCNMEAEEMLESCELWDSARNYNVAGLGNLTKYFANELNIRAGGIREMERCLPDPDNPSACNYSVRVLFNDNFTVSYT